MIHIHCWHYINPDNGEVDYTKYHDNSNVFEVRHHGRFTKEVLIGFQQECCKCGKKRIWRIAGA
jgi:hypothetical protein